jgi:hypothetical protein
VLRVFIFSISFIKWNQSSVKSILTNEKYKADALLQKSCTVDSLTKKKKMNESGIPQYLEGEFARSNHRAACFRDGSARVGAGNPARTATAEPGYSQAASSAANAAVGTALKLAQQHQVPQDNLAMQPEIQGRRQMQNTPS